MNQALQVVNDGPGTDLVEWEPEIDDKATAGLAKITRYGLIALAVLVIGFGGLMAFLPMAGAVIAQGEISVETSVREIAHPFGGVAAEIRVRDGDEVKEGDVLIRLDDTVAGAAAEFSGLSLDQLLGREARLRALRDGSGGIAFPQELLDRADEPGVRLIMQDERRELSLARQALSDQRNQLSARISQIRAEIGSNTSRIAALDRQDALIGEELEQTRELYESRLSTLDRLNALERAAVGLDADRDAARADNVSLQARIGELSTQMAGLGSETRARAAAQLSEVQAMIADSRQREVTASDTNDRTAIRAPQDGIVNKLQIKTIGGVVPPGETLLEIVPAADRLIVTTQVLANDIDEVGVGQPATLHFTALSMRTAPELKGTVTRVDADNTVDPNTGVSYYNARVEITDEEFARLGDVKVSVGMPVEVFIQTGERTILTYILRPLSDQIRRALRE